MSEIKKTLSPLRVNPQPTLKIEKSARIRAAILSAALEFVWSHPFRNLTVNALMASTGLSRSAFYQYFKDLYEVMETLLGILEDEIFEVAAPWIAGVGDPVALIHETFAGLVHLCHERGPFLRAFTDAAATDERFEEAWRQFLGQFDDAAYARIEADQAQGLIPDFDVRPVAIALTRLNAAAVIEAFGQRPRRQPEPVREALARIWISTLYGSEWIGNGSSDLVRT